MVKVLLEQTISQALVDPRRFKSDEEYIYAQKIAWAYGQHASDLLATLAQMEEEAEALVKKEKGENVDKLREGLS